jgi:hypothetical protein
MIYNKLAILESRLANIQADKLGIPQRKRVLARKTIYNPTTKLTTTEDVLISPKLYVTSVKPRYINLPISDGNKTVYISVNDLMIEIPRTYDKSFFDSRIRFAIDPPDDLTKADWYILRFIDDSSSIIWNLIISKEIDKK